MVVMATDIKFYTSASVDSADSSKISLGGAITTTEASEAINGLFDVLTGAESRVATDEYRVIYARNTKDLDDGGTASSNTAVDCRFYLTGETNAAIDATSKKLQLQTETDSLFSLGVGRKNVAVAARTTDDNTPPQYNQGSGNAAAMFSETATRLSTEDMIDRALKSDSSPTGTQIDLAASSGGAGGDYVPIFLRRNYAALSTRSAQEVAVRLYVAFDQQP